MAQFYIARPPDHLGCFSLDEVVEKLHSGEFRTDDLAFKEGFPGWKQISEIPELMDKLKLLQEADDEMPAAAPVPGTPPAPVLGGVPAAAPLPSIAPAAPCLGAAPADPGSPLAPVDTEPKKKGFFARIFGKDREDAPVPDVEVEPVEPSLSVALAPVPGGVPAAAPVPGAPPAPVAPSAAALKPPTAPAAAPAAEDVGGMPPAPSLPLPAAPALAAIPMPALASMPGACLDDDSTLPSPVPIPTAPALLEIPAEPTQTDQVNFSAMAQGQLEADAQFILDIWAHTESQTEQVKERANEMGRGDLKGTKQGIGIVQGHVLEVHLSLPGFEVADPVDLLTWNGAPVNASFPVTAPKDCTEGSHLGTAAIHSHGLMICKLHFQIEIGAGARAASEDLTVKTEHPRTAFASYSSQNRNEVLGCLQGMQKVAPDLDVDIDVISLRSGQDYRKTLGRLIPAKDVFFLFWSQAASESKWVEWEWRLALNNKGLGFIDPVPLEDPRQVPPPAELSSLHFGDKWISFKNATKQ